MGAALKFKKANIPRQKGERARVKVQRGPDYGAVFVITGGRATLGRGEDNDIVLTDLKTSRQHAEIVLTETGWAVRDLNSANGILHNGAATKVASLNLRDTISLGETTLEFLSADQNTLMLLAPVKDAALGLSEQAVFEEQVKKVRQIGVVGARALPGLDGYEKKVAKSDPKKVLLLGAVALAAVFFFFGETETQKPQKKKPAAGAAKNSELEKYLPTPEAPIIVKSADVFFKTGFREYRQHNWLRAKVQFETVLQMSPGHQLATLYLENCEARIKEEVRTHLETGRKSFDVGKLRDAKGNFEAVLRLLYRDQTNPGYIEANEQLQKVMKEMKTEVAE